LGARVAAVSLLTVAGLSKSFGGVRAVDDLAFNFGAKKIHSIIGPNGAGKTTVLNLITGIYTPSAGRIRLEDRDVTGLPPHALAALGISRTFQNLQIFLNMTAIENVMVGAHLRLDHGAWPALLRLPQIVRGDAACRAEAEQLLEFVGLKDYRDADADALPYGALKRLEIARALAARPKLLLLDEPAAGLNAAETRQIDALIAKVVESGVTVVLVEHNMKLVMGISDHIVVLDHGRKLAEGTVAAVRSNPDVIAAYLGSSALGAASARPTA